MHYFINSASAYMEEPESWKLLQLKVSDSISLEVR